MNKAVQTLDLVSQGLRYLAPDEAEQCLEVGDQGRLLFDIFTNFSFPDSHDDLCRGLCWIGWDYKDMLGQLLDGALHLCSVLVLPTNILSDYSRRLGVLITHIVTEIIVIVF